MRAAIIKLLDNHISGAEDNANRARMAFGRMTADQSSKEYGQSGRTCQQILTEANEALAAAKAMKSWFEANVK